jgi:hypothetical protein
MLKTRYLKGITIEQLFIISIARDFSEFSLIYLTLKNRIRDTYLLFCFHNLRSHQSYLYS